MDKATKAESEERTLTIYDLLCKGYSFNDIVEYCIQKYNIKKAQTSRYIKRATKRIMLNNEREVEEKRAEAVTRYLRWMKIYEEKEDYFKAAKMQKRIDKINGLEVENINLQHSISKEDLKQIADAWTKGISKTEAN